MGFLIGSFHFKNTVIGMKIYSTIEIYYRAVLVEFGYIIIARQGKNSIIEDRSNIIEWDQYNRDKYEYIEEIENFGLIVLGPNFTSREKIIYLVLSIMFNVERMNYSAALRLIAIPAYARSVQM